MDLGDPIVIPSCIVVAGGAVAAAMRWAVNRVVGAVDANTTETRRFGDALAAQRTELAVYAEASRNTITVLMALHAEVVKMSTQLSTAMRLAPGDSEPPPNKPAREPARERPGTPIRGIPVPGGAYSHVRKRTENDE